MSSFFFYAASFAVLLGTLVIVHELGHYLVARWCGVKVVRFSVGFGQPVFVVRLGADATEWALGIFPLGGYVKMLDEREGEVAPEELPRSFNRQSVWKRIAIVAAGPLANFLTAILVYWAVFVHGSEELRPILGVPVASTPAAASGIENGERVLKAGGEVVQTWQDMRWNIIRYAVDHDSIDLEVINLRQEIAIRRLYLTEVRAGGWEGDAVEKLGLTLYRPTIPPVIGQIGPGSPAEVSGLQVGDTVLFMNDRPIHSWHEVVHLVRGAPGNAIEFIVLRRGQHHRLDIVPAPKEEGGKVFGRIGAGVRDAGEIRQQLMVTVRHGVISALGKAFSETWDKTVFSVEMIGRMLVGEVSWKNISGPVSIADYAGQSARLGLDYYLKFMALVSVSLAVLNLLPIPILDGGHLLYYVAEIIKGGPLSERSMEIGQKLGLALMLLLMACAFYNDINRLLSG